MNLIPHSDNFKAYDEALQGLKLKPNDIEFQHQAILALARAGSTHFAITEYERYGLDKVSGHEDIMALKGRLSKDLYIASVGKAALEHARDSAQYYEHAFQSTKGYYSGINSATLALLADMPREIINDRVHNILRILPDAKNLSAEDHYFIEATRAECYLLLQQDKKAKTILRAAVSFDPLNYAAHATTLKQFRLILENRKSDTTWLHAFSPPQTAHFAGHLWHKNTDAFKALPDKISDIIQQNDIGFGYGSLAAGSDILIAEALLREGAELNVVLPNTVEHFLNASVIPYGKQWAKRFQLCLDQAHSVTTLHSPDAGFNVTQNILGAGVAMGRALLRSRELSVSATQLLIFDPRLTHALTAHHHNEWTQNGQESVIIPYRQEQQSRQSLEPLQESLPVIMRRSDMKSLIRFDSLSAAIKALKDHKASDEGAMCALHFDLPGSQNFVDLMIARHFPGSLHVSEAIACFISLKHSDAFKLTFAGQVENDRLEIMRTYNIKHMD